MRLFAIVILMMPRELRPNQDKAGQEQYTPEQDVELTAGGSGNREADQALSGRRRTITSKCLLSPVKAIPPEFQQPLNIR
jgi:hypothetical protein